VGQRERSDRQVHHREREDVVRRQLRPAAGLKEVIADDFQGTDAEGQRYGKKQAMEFSFNKDVTSPV
jgi:hypothetical protein